MILELSLTRWPSSLGIIKHRLMLERCVILKLVREYPDSTCYQLHKKFNLLQLNMSTSGFYALIKRMGMDGLLVLTPRILIRPKIPKGRHVMENQPDTRRRVGGHLRINPIKKRILINLSITGLKELMALEFKIQIALTMSIYGKKV